MADSFATPSRSISSRSSLPFLEALSAEEGWTDTNAYWEALLLRKAGQTSMLTGKHSESLCS